MCVLNIWNYKMRMKRPPSNQYISDNNVERTKFPLRTLSKHFAKVFSMYEMEYFVERNLHKN